MAFVLRKLIIIISTSIFLQPIIQGQYVIYNDNGNENMDLPIFNDNDVSESNSPESFELENMFLNKELNDLDFFYQNRESRNSGIIKSEQRCMAVPIPVRHFGTETTVYKPSEIQEFGCEKYNSSVYNSSINGGICYIPNERCTPMKKYMTFLIKNIKSNSHWWFYKKHYISVGCKCHNLNDGF